VGSIPRLGSFDCDWQRALRCLAAIAIDLRERRMVRQRAGKSASDGL
jgi:hypothetical protein